jgi:hypothetical protein
MSDNAKMLFNLQRFQIMSRFVDTVDARNFSPAYAFAWDKSVYPASNHGGDWHEPYKHVFSVTEAAMDELTEFLDKRWRSKQPLSFYQLEAHFDPQSRFDGAFAWDRMDLVYACRYLKLADLFDDQFWKNLVGGHDCPSESHSVNNPYTKADVYFE